MPAAVFASDMPRLSADVATLVVSSYMPTRASGRAARTYGIVRALAVSGPVDLLHTGFGADAPDPAYEAVDGLSLYSVTNSRGARRALAWARSRATGVPRAVARGVSPELASAAERLAQVPGRGRVIAEDAMAAVGLLRLARRRPVIYSANNLESAFRPGRDPDWGSRSRLEAFERRLLGAAAETWMPSPADLEGARELAPDAALRYVPNVVDVAAIDPRREPADPPEALLVGNFAYAPNREGLDFLLDEVMPRVWAAAPQVRLSVAGRGFDAPAGADERVTALGFVDNLEPVYARAACALVPLLSGGGSPVKFIEALAHGLPVVTTPRGAAGVDAESPRHYLEGAGAEGFAKAMLDALDPARGAAVGSAGRALAGSDYSIEALARRLAQ
ncbi:MAG: polysaccharide biosynthesis protein PslH [Thermoleophilaceae bacterium]|jgi:glycosyltransferase involved in cell wall biosynthesis|nr:polysaccharide biosynthesis protein PslH [Thermoleophilaceae bacterium]